MQKNFLTNKITPCGNLPFSVVYWWVKNLTLNSEADRQFILSKIAQNGTISIEGWKVLANSATLEADASFNKPTLLSWFDCGKQPSKREFKMIIESLVLGNWNPEDRRIILTDLTELNDGIELNDKFTGTPAVFKKDASLNNSDVDGVIVLNIEGEIYKRVIESSIDVKWFGAKGDGTTDDTVAIQSAFDYVFKQKTQNKVLPTVHVPSGKFIITDTLKFPSSGSLTGEGVGASLLKMIDPNKDLLHVKTSKTDPNTQDVVRQYTTIRNIIFLGANSDIPASHHKEDSAPNSNGIVVDTVIKVNIENCEINGFNNAGLTYIGTYYNKLQNTISRNNRFGIVIKSVSTSLQATGCEFRQNTAGVIIEDSWANSFVNCLIETNFNAYAPPPQPHQAGYDVKTHSGTGVYMYNSRANYFTNCYLEANTVSFNFLASKNNVVSSCFISVGLTQTGMPTFMNPFMAVFLTESHANVFQNNFYETYPLEFKELLIYSNSFDNYFVGSKDEMYKFREQNLPYIQANIDSGYPERNVRFYGMSEHLFLDTDSVIKTM